VKKRRRVALLIETSNAYARGVTRGIVEFVRHHEPWSIVVQEQGRGADPPRWLKGWKGDGMIARIETPEIAQAITRVGCPVVDVSAGRYLKHVPWVETDDRSVVDLAVEHLLERGFQSLAFCGDAGFNWSVWRQTYFTEIVQQRGARSFVHETAARTSPGYSWPRVRAGLKRWLKKLPRPIGVIACYDIRAQQLLDLCREQDIGVPEEMAVIGVDNDELLCELAEPPLTSVICNTHRTGYLAASLLQRQMDGEQIGGEATLLKPIGVATRQSTETLVIEDPDIAAALRFIREHAWQGINVADVLRVVPLTRRVLEKRFRRSIGRTPHEEINRLRIGRVKQLLLETDLTLSEIATRTGYQHDEYLSVAFKKAVGCPPGRFRRTAGAAERRPESGDTAERGGG